MLLHRSPIKAAFALATIFSLLVSSSKAHEVNEACANETAIIQSDPTVLASIGEIINGTMWKTLRPARMMAVPFPAPTTLRLLRRTSKRSVPKQEVRSS
jgi:hypothetical protein